MSVAPRAYPRTVDAGGGPVTLRYMGPGDREAMLAFARALPVHDLLFLPLDITRPEAVDGRGVPEVLLGGDHAAVRRWRLKQALGRTWLRRPQLLAARVLTAEESELLEEFRDEWSAVNSDSEFP